MNRSFDCDTPGSIFVSDIIYVPCSDGRIYLTTFLDMATRMPKAYGITNHMRKECVIEPLKKLIESGIQEGAIIHSDQGSQYRSYAFFNLCEASGLKQSMSPPGSPIDNAVAEAFFKSIKTEIVYPNRHHTKEQMEVLVRNYVEEYYPKERIHTKLGMTPYQYEQQLLREIVT